MEPKLNITYPPFFSVYMDVRLSDNPFTPNEAADYMLSYLSGDWELDKGYQEAHTIWYYINRRTLRFYEMWWMKALRDEAKGAHPSNG